MQRSALTVSLKTSKIVEYLAACFASVLSLKEGKFIPDFEKKPCVKSTNQHALMMAILQCDNAHCT